jgi:hypothetical protein
MRTGIVLLMAAFVTSASTQNVNELSQFLGGAGATKCETWLKEREDPASVLAFGLEGWVLGYVSGANPSIELPPGMLANVTEGDVFSRTDFYCREHRSNILFQAAAVVTADLMGARASSIRKNLKKR